MSIKTAIIDILLRIAGLILRRVEREEYDKQIIVKQKVSINDEKNEKPYRYMSDEVKRFIMQDLTPNDKVKVSCDIALFEGAKVNPYTLTAPESERYYIITDGQITGSGTYK